MTYPAFLVGTALPCFQLPVPNLQHMHVDFEDKTIRCIGTHNKLVNEPAEPYYQIDEGRGGAHHVR